LYDPTLIAEFDHDKISIDKGDWVSLGDAIKELPTKHDSKGAFQFFSNYGTAHKYVYQILLPTNYYTKHKLIFSSGGKTAQPRAYIVTRKDVQNITVVNPENGDSQFLAYFFGPDMDIYGKILGGKKMHMEGSFGTTEELFDKYKKENDPSIKLEIKKGLHLLPDS
jgi:hypothetical protein